jgi:hypothetical protein
MAKGHNYSHRIRSQPRKHSGSEGSGVQLERGSLKGCGGRKRLIEGVHHA